MVGRQNQWPPRCSLEGWLQRSICCSYSKFNAQFCSLNHMYTDFIGFKFMLDGYVYFLYWSSFSYILVAYQDAGTCIWFWQTVSSFHTRTQVSISVHVCYVKMLLWYTDWAPEENVWHHHDSGQRARAFHWDGFSQVRELGSSQRIWCSEKVGQLPNNWHHFRLENWYLFLEDVVCFLIQD